MYRTAVVENGFSYERFREDFIHSHTFHDSADADSRNDHLVNLGRIGSLLSTRQDLIQKYFNSALSQDEFRSCMKEFMIESPRMRARLLNLECYLSDESLRILTEAANDIPLFKRDVTPSDMDCLFNKCSPATGGPLVANSNEVLSYFFSRLNYKGIISNKYQTILADLGLVVRSTGSRPLTQTDISSALRHFEISENPVRSRVEKWVLLIKSSTLRPEEATT